MGASFPIREQLPSTFKNWGQVVWLPREGSRESFAQLLDSPPAEMQTKNAQTTWCTPGLSSTVLRAAGLRHARFEVVLSVLGFRNRSPVPWVDSRVKLGKCVPSSFPVQTVLLRACLLVVLDVLSVFQSPRFNSFFGGKTFFLGVYSYIPHSGFPEVLWECRMGTVISKSGRENEQFRKVYAIIASKRQFCT